MKKDMENKNSQVLSHFNMGKSPEEKIKQQQSNSLQMKDVMNKYMVDNGLTKTEATYKVAIDGKSVEKKYTIIGTPEYAKNISQHILTISKSEYGAKMLNGLANTNDSLYFMQFKNKTTTSSRVLDPYIDKNTDKYASIISLDLNRKAPSYGTTSSGNFLKTQNITNHQNIAVNSAAEKQNATQYALDTNKNNASIASASIKETNRLKSEQQPGMEA